MKKLLFLSVIVILFFTQCKEEIAPSVDMGYNYFPTTQGLYVVYDVDSLVWDDIPDPPTSDTFHYTIKLRLEDSYVNSSGEIVYRWVKYLRKDSTGYAANDVLGAIPLASTLEVIEGNVPKLRMIFPVKLGQEWDQDIFHPTKEELEYRYVEVDEPASVAGNSFDSTCLAEHSPIANLLKDVYLYDRFARNIGLIERYERKIDTEINGDIISGSILHYRIRSYGIEMFP